ncbi:MAG: hypothetical protein KBS53_06155 [Bacteroidales bacterium]|nr:hypothetical protein [Candidatus Hennigimonas equi]
MGDSKTKESRLKAISAIITKYHISNQEELVNKLKKDGFEVTQATLSRDLKTLQVVKVPVGDGYRYSIGHRHKIPSRGSSDNILSIDISGNLAVIKTAPGFAGAVALTIDNNVTSHNLMGTIAGDDTILVILRKASALTGILDEAEHYIPGIKNKMI